MPLRRRKVHRGQNFRHLPVQKTASHPDTPHPHRIAVQPSELQGCPPARAALSGGRDSCLRIGQRKLLAVGCLRCCGFSGLGLCGISRLCLLFLLPSGLISLNGLLQILELVEVFELLDLCLQNVDLSQCGIALKACLSCFIDIFLDL